MDWLRARWRQVLRNADRRLLSVRRLALAVVAVCCAVASLSVPASAAPNPTSLASCGLVMAAAQPAAGCVWAGTITLSQTLTSSTSTPVPATPTNHGGTQTNALDEHDTTTVQLSAEGSAVVN